MDVIGRDFFTRMFERRPELLQLFSFRDDPDWKASRVLQKHAAAVVRRVGELVAGLDNLPSVLPSLAALGKTHAALAIEPGHFDVLRECLLEALQEVLGPAWSREVRS